MGNKIKMAAKLKLNRYPVPEDYETLQSPKMVQKPGSKGYSIQKDFIEVDPILVNLNSCN